MKFPLEAVTRSDIVIGSLSPFFSGLSHASDLSETKDSFQNLPDTCLHHTPFKELLIDRMGDEVLQNRFDGGSTKGPSFHFFFRDGLAKRRILDVCDQVKQWPNRQSMS